MYIYFWGCFGTESHAAGTGEIPSEWSCFPFFFGGGEELVACCSWDFFIYKLIIFVHTHTRTQCEVRYQTTIKVAGIRRR